MPGVIYLSGELNYEEHRKINMHVFVTSIISKKTSYIDLVIDVVDFNEFAPMFVRGHRVEVDLQRGFYEESFNVTTVSS